MDFTCKKWILLRFRRCFETRMDVACKGVLNSFPTWHLVNRTRLGTRQMVCRALMLRLIAALQTVEFLHFVLSFRRFSLFAVNSGERVVRLTRQRAVFLENDHSQ